MRSFLIICCASFVLLGGLVCSTSILAEGAIPLIWDQTERLEGSGKGECSIELLNRNFSEYSAEVSRERNVATSKDKDKFLSTGRLVPCSPAELLQLGFQHTGSSRYNGDSSTNGAFESIDTFQKDHLLVSCYFEFELTNRSRSSAVTWSRSACGQTVPYRLYPKLK